MLSALFSHSSKARLAGAVALALCISLVSCGDTALFSDSSSGGVTLPYETTIRDDQDRSLDITLIYRTSDSIHFVRNSDKREFDLPMSKLSDADRRWISKLPVSTPESRAATLRDQQNQIYIKNRQDAVGRVEEEIQELADDIASGRLSNSQIRNHDREIERKREEIRDIESKIKEYQKR